MKTALLAASVGLLAVTLAPERAATATVPPLSAGTSSSLIVHVSDRCTRLWRRCNRGNLRACRNYRVECRWFRPIY